MAYGNRIGRTKWNRDVWDSGEITFVIGAAAKRKLAVVMHFCPYHTNGVGGRTSLK